MATVCIQFSCLVESLNSTSGIAWWRNKTRSFFGFLRKLIRRRRKEDILEEEKEKEAESALLSRTTSVIEGMALRVRKPTELRDELLANVDSEKDNSTKNNSTKNNSTKIEGQNPKTSVLNIEPMKTDARTE